MSDPLRTTEIEDVLASIRRLVSQEASAQPARPRSGPPRLLLTPAQRIVDGAPQPSKAERPPLVLGHETAPPIPRTTFQSVRNPLNGLPGGRTGARSSDMTLTSPIPVPDARAATPTLEERIAELEAAVASQSVEFEPDGSEDPDQHRPLSVPSHPGRFRIENVSQPNEFPDFLGALKGKAASEESDRFDAPQSSRIDISTIVRGAVADEVARVAPSTAEEVTPTASSAMGSSPIDEAALRQMVAQIVREELQGALGERITRNVRKLIRRELLRSQTVRDLA